QGGAAHAGGLSATAHARRPLPMAVDGEEVECIVGITDGCLALAQCREKGIRISRTELSNNNNLDPFRVSGKFGKDLATFFPAAITRPPPSRASGCRAGAGRFPAHPAVRGGSLPSGRGSRSSRRSDR